MWRCFLLVVVFVAAVQVLSIAGLETSDVDMLNREQTMEDVREMSPRHRSRRAITLTEAQKKEVVDRHNVFRRLAGASNMEHMKWNDELARWAANWADKCVWKHGFPSWDNKPFKTLGQNLYITGSTPVNLTIGIQAFYDEVAYYDYDSKTCRAPPNKSCGHYTQVVWATTREVGCAVAHCDSMDGSTAKAVDYLVYNYGPAGNVKGERPFEKGEPCTACLSGQGWCDKGLCRRDCEPSDNCECKVQCSNSGVLNMETCSCTCVNGWMGIDCTRKCKDYSDNCGRHHWPKSWCNEEHSYVLRNCPLMCGLCDPECLNSGVFNKETRKCDCAKGWTGVDCTRECKDYNVMCGTYKWPVSWCDKAHDYVLQSCPLSCKLCDPECLNSGVFNEETRKCDCAKGWTGVDCTRECKDYNVMCGTYKWPESWCDKAHDYVLQTCPLSCKLCVPECKLKCAHSGVLNEETCSCSGCENGWTGVDCTNPECANSGVFNMETRKCDCAKGWTGLDCTRECKNYNIKCGANPGWPKYWCGEGRWWVLKYCPLMCGLCESLDAGANSIGA